LPEAKDTPALAAPDEKAVSPRGEKLSPALAAQGEKPAPGPIVEAAAAPPAALYGEGGAAVGGETKERPSPDKPAAPLSLKEPSDGQEPAEAKDATPATGQEAIAVGEPAKGGFAQRLHFERQELGLKDTQELVGQLVEQAKLTQRPGASEMTIRLKPENLGEMTVRIVAESGGVISAAFHSNNSEVRAILQEALPAIRQELSSSGLKVSDVGVYAGLGDFQSFAQNQPDNGPEGKTNKIGRLRLRPEEPGQEADIEALGGENLSGAGGVDYRV
jgi:flagellar hook-length control protein FliK